MYARLSLRMFPEARAEDRGFGLKTAATADRGPGSCGADLFATAISIRTGA